MRTLFVVLILAFPAVAAPIPKEAKRTPLEQLQGKWIIVSIDKGEGPIVPEGDFATYTLTIDGIHISTATAVSSAYPKVPAKFDFKSDPIKMDMPFGGDKVIPGIVKIDGDRLEWCHAPGGGGTRPTEFQGGDGHHYYIWKRAAK